MIRIGDLALYGLPENNNKTLAVVTGDNVVRSRRAVPHYQFYHVNWRTVTLTEKRANFLEVLEVP